MKARVCAGVVIETDGRHLAPAEFAAGKQPAMPADHLELGINQHRHVEAEGLDAAGDLPDLFLAVEPRVPGVGLEIVHPAVNNRHLKSNAWSGARSAFHLICLWPEAGALIAPARRIWFRGSQQPKSANRPPSFFGGRFPADF